MLWVARVMAKARKIGLLADALTWLGTGGHRGGCSCHRCLWATGVRAGRVTRPFEVWRKRK